MKTQEWQRFLIGLIAATERGTAHWSRGDLPNTWVLSQPGGSVVVRGPRDLPGLVEVTAANGRPLVNVEVRARNDQTVDHLPTTLSLMGSGRIFDRISEAGEPTVLDVEPLQVLAQDLLDTVIVSSPTGSAVADDILRDLDE